MMEIAFEKIYRQLLDIKTELKTETKAGKVELTAAIRRLETGIKGLEAEIGRLRKDIDSGKTWFTVLSMATILTVTFIITAVVRMQLN